MFSDSTIYDICTYIRYDILRCGICNDLRRAVFCLFVLPLRKLIKHEEEEEEEGKEEEGCRIIGIKLNWFLIIEIYRFLICRSRERESGNGGELALNSLESVAS